MRLAREGCEKQRLSTSRWKRHVSIVLLPAAGGNDKSNGVVLNIGALCVALTKRCLQGPRTPSELGNDPAELHEKRPLARAPRRA